MRRILVLITTKDSFKAILLKFSNYEVLISLSQLK